MLALYFEFLRQFNRCIFTFGSAALAKWNKASLKKVDGMSKGMLVVGASINMLYPVLIWLYTKFQYHLPIQLFPIELSCFVVANLIENIFYFYNNFGSGKVVQLTEIS